jgi:uncharacterized OsmC-like protein
MEHLVVELQRADRKVHFNCVSAAHPDITVPLDYTPPLGEGNGLAGLEVLLMSFAGCVSTAIVALLARLGKHINSYSVKAEGVRREQPLSLSAILFHVTIESEDIAAADMDAVLRQAEQISPVWIAIKNNVAVEATYNLIQP